MLRKIIGSLLVLILTVAMISAYAEIQPKASELLVSRGVNKYTLGDGKVKFTADITGKRPMDKIGFKTIKIQELYGNTWRTVKTVRDKYNYNSAIYMYSVTYDGRVGLDYRAYVEYYAQFGSKSDTKTTVTTPIVAK